MIDRLVAGRPGTVSAGRATVLALGLLAAGLLAWQPLLTFAQLRAGFGDMYDAPMLLASMGVSLLCVVGTVVGAWSHTLRPIAAGSVLGIGLLVAWSTAWRLASPIMDESAWVTGIGALLAIGTGTALLTLRDGTGRDARVTSAE